MFLPTTVDELIQLGWSQLDVILVTGDSYIDSPFIGAAMIGKLLLSKGYRVGIIAQPDMDKRDDIVRLGEPALFWGVTAGSIDSMLANYTAIKKKRKHDDYTPGGINNRRPDRACIGYTNLIRRYFKDTKPIVLGGIEASLRRVAHYDYWSDRIRAPILFDAKADILIYGMGESAVLALAESLKTRMDYFNIRGLCYLSKKKKDGYIELPSFDEVVQSKQAFIEMFNLFYANNDPISGKGLIQRKDQRYLIQNPPSYDLSQGELDAIYNMRFERAQHPYYEKLGPVKALETIRFSISTHRGCYGECNFCAIAVHEGRTVNWRSPASILAEARELASLPGFKGYILDVGGPTANMYGFECAKKLKKGPCNNKRCIYPDVCPLMHVDHSRQIELLKEIRKISGVKKVFIASGIRYDMILADKSHGAQYLEELAAHHVSGQLKIAPEHIDSGVLALMGKPNAGLLLDFKEAFDRASKNSGKPQFLTYYFIAAHPGCSELQMDRLRRFTRQKLKIAPEQVQVFTPTPSTYSTLMYYTGVNPFTGEPVFVEKTLAGKEKQKRILTEKMK